MTTKYRKRSNITSKVKYITFGAAMSGAVMLGAVIMFVLLEPDVIELLR